MECLGTPSPDYGRYIFVFRWEPSDLPESVLNTIYHARAPSTRHLYALKWSSPPGVLPAAQTLFVGKGLLPFHSQGLCSSYSSLTRSYMVNQWAGTTWLFISWRGLGGLIRPALSPVPTWNLPTVLRALNSPPFELIQSVDLRPLTLKTCSATSTSIGKTYGRSAGSAVSPSCLEFWPNDICAIPHWNSGHN